MLLKDKVTVTDSLELRDGEGNVRGSSPPRDDAPQIEGVFSLRLRERGKLVPGGSRTGKNIWTLTGREYLAQLMSYQALGPSVPFRNDRIAYVGFGVGIQPEVAAVAKVLSPIAWDVVAGNFLAALSIPDFPLSPARTTVRYFRAFGVAELSLAGPVILSEAGLYTDGNPAAVPPYDPGTRDTTFTNAALQAPAAYKAFDPLKKTNNFELEVFWEIRM